MLSASFSRIRGDYPPWCPPYFDRGVLPRTPSESQIRSGGNSLIGIRHLQREWRPGRRGGATTEGAFEAAVQEGEVLALEEDEAVVEEREAVVFH